MRKDSITIAMSIKSHQQKYQEVKAKELRGHAGKEIADQQGT